MKKLMNDPDAFVDEMLEGLCAASPGLVQDPQDKRVIRRANPSGSSKVGIVSGGGSGHLPLFTGYVGEGLLDACAIGDVFAGPTVNACMNAMKAADRGQGVLRLYGNYGGDRMNFDLAGEMLEDEGLRSTTVLGTDDIASAPADNARTRRGVAGIVFSFKVAGAAADEGLDLEAVTELAQRSVDRTRTVGVAVSSCQLPGAAAPTFELGENEIEIGMGIHGEPGFSRSALRSADEIADEMVTRILSERPEGADGQVALLVNSLGSTSLEETYILYRRASAKLAEQGYDVAFPLVGRYVTSLEMGGASISVMHLDDDLVRLLKAPAACPFWVVQ